MRNISIMILLMVVITDAVFSIPRFSLRSGGQCIDCHVNPTGGLIRNSDGWQFGNSNLKMWSAHKEGSEFETSPMIGKNINYGFDFRTQYLVAFDSSRTRSDFHRMTGSIYLNTTVSEKINLLARYDFVQQVWEAYGIANVLPYDGYIKVGTYTPNFGIKLDDHTAYTRMGDYHVITNSNFGLPFSPRYTETGVEIGYTIADFAFLTMSAGGGGSPSFQQDPAYTANLSLSPALSDQFNILLGGSFASQKRYDLAGLNLMNTTLAGFFAGFAAGPFTMLAEYDNAKSLYQNDSTVNALMLEGAYKITKGLEAMVRYDRMGGDNPFTNDGSKLKLSHIVVGLNWYPYSFIEIIPQYRIHTEDPEIKNDALVLQFHFWY